MEKVITPVVSVVMPVYNGEEYLREAMASILNQTFEDFELIVINDGSTDSTTDIVYEFEKNDSRVVHIRQENAGIVSALNRGLELARGDYIARMDADDICHPERFAVQVEFLRNNRDYVVCGSDYELLGASGEYVRTPRGDAACRAKLLYESCFAHPTVMIRSSALRDLAARYEAEFQYAEDYQLWTKLSHAGLLHNIGMALLKYRVHAAQISSSKKQIQRERHAKAAISHLTEMGVEVTGEQFHTLLWPELNSFLGGVLYLGKGVKLSCKLVSRAQDARMYLLMALAKVLIRNAVKSSIGVGLR